ncbi:uncharacterized protein LOC134680901 [Mytilus trossulus]|uniref:uncharacterized protein LOC134680901 n=1 Tax=Mytilus trossulus TaxID=6551 RepID=UPI0030045B26
MNSRCKAFLRLDTERYHVFCSYCERDSIRIEPVVKYFKRRGCLVNDFDPTTGQPVLQAIVDDEIDQSKSTVLFITNNFLADERCQAMINIAIMKYIDTKGRHRIVSVIMEKCSIPLPLKMFKCIHVWKSSLPLHTSTWGGRHFNSAQIFDLIVKCITDAPPKFKRIQKYGLKTLIYTKNSVEKVQLNVSHNKSAKKKRFISPIQLWKLSKNLHYCFIHCRYGQCSFFCRGENVHLFSQHVQECKYQPNKCPNEGCLIASSKYSLANHLESCPFSTTNCPSEGCDKRLKRRLLGDHLHMCHHRLIPCPYNKSGCQEVMKRENMKEHASKCKFKVYKCQYCWKTVLWKEADLHLEKCNNITIKCECCRHAILKREKITHEKVCLKAHVSCPNPGCGMQMKGYQYLQHKNYCQYRIVNCKYKQNGCRVKAPNITINSHIEKCPYRSMTCDICEKEVMAADLERHTSECTSVVSCKRCNQQVAKSALNLHNRLCPRKNYKIVCDICRQLVDPYQLENHKSQCQNCITDCPYTRKGCHVRESVMSIDRHAKECLFRPAICEDCGLEMTTSEMDLHLKDCLKDKVCQSADDEESEPKLELENDKRENESSHQQHTDLDHAVSTKFITHQGSTIENEALQNVTLISFDKVLPIAKLIDCSGGIWDENRSSTKWTGGRYAKGRRKFNYLLDMIDKKRLNIKTSDIKHICNYGCKKYDNDLYGVLQFR